MTDLPIPPDFCENAKTHTVVELVSIYNRSRETITKWKRKLGLKTKRQNIPIPDSFCEAAPTCTIDELSKRYCVSPSTIKGWLKRRCVRQKGSTGERGPYKFMKEQISDSPEQIAACLHCPHEDCCCRFPTAPCFPLGDEKEVLDVIS